MYGISLLYFPHSQIQWHTCGGEMTFEKKIKKNYQFFFLCFPPLVPFSPPCDIYCFLFYTPHHLTSQQTPHMGSAFYTPFWKTNAHCILSTHLGPQGSRCYIDWSRSSLGMRIPSVHLVVSHLDVFEWAEGPGETGTPRILVKFQTSLPFPHILDEIYQCDCHPSI